MFGTNISHFRAICGPIGSAPCNAPKELDGSADILRGEISQTTQIIGGRARKSFGSAKLFGFNHLCNLWFILYLGCGRRP